MQLNRYTKNVLIGVAAVVLAGAQMLPGHEKSGPVLTTVSTALASTSVRDTLAARAAAAVSSASSGAAGEVTAALAAFAR